MVYMQLIWESQRNLSHLSWLVTYRDGLNLSHLRNYLRQLYRVLFLEIFCNFHLFVWWMKLLKIRNWVSNGYLSKSNQNLVHYLSCQAQALNLLDLALCFPSASIYSVFMVLYI